MRCRPRGRRPRSRTRRGRRTGRSRTSGSSSSATACSSSRSRTSCTRAIPEFSEGRLAKIRSHVVSRASCAVVARELELGAAARAAQSDGLQADELERLSKNRNVLAALLEAVLGALFLEHGFAAIEAAVVERVRGPHRLRADDARRPQDGAAGGAGAQRAGRSSTPCSRPKGRRTSATSPARPSSTASSSAWARAARRRPPSRRPPARRSKLGPRRLRQLTAVSSPAWATRRRTPKLTAAARGGGAQREERGFSSSSSDADAPLGAATR